MATVFLAYDHELERQVAVKVLGGAENEEFVRRFRREAMTAAGLGHTNIVSVFDAGEEDGSLFIVMEHVEGENLDALLVRAGRLELERALGYVEQACAGLGHAHERGVVHRDVKPANLLVRTDGILKVTDFGIAQAGGGTTLTQAGTLLGTASYIAPEQARGEPIGPQTDLFSLGVVLYQLLSGALPWRVAGLADIQAVGETPPRPLRDVAPGIPVHVEAAVGRCLDPEPRNRPASAKALAQELRGGPPTTATVVREASPSAPTALLDHAPRRPVRVRVRGGRPALLAAVLLVAALVAVLAATSEDGDGSGTRIERVPPAEAATQQSRNLADWLREHTETPKR